MDQNNFSVTADLYASKEKRFINMVIDTIGYYAFSFIIGLILGVFELLGISGPLNFIASMGAIGSFIFSISIMLAYFCLLEVPFQKSLGKFATKTIVVMEDGSKPTFQDIFIRSLCRLIPFEAFSFLGQDGRGWHDSMSNTYVVEIDRFEAKKRSLHELNQIGVAQEL